jgi:hypothetical protein
LSLYGVTEQWVSATWRINSNLAIYLNYMSNFLIIKPTRCANFSNLFWSETLHVSDSSPVHHQELFTVQSAMAYVIQTAFEQQDQDGTAVPSWSCCSKAVCITYTIAVCTVITPDDGQKNCPKHVEFHFQNKFEKLLHPFGFIIRTHIRILLLYMYLNYHIFAISTYVYI